MRAKLFTADSCFGLFPVLISELNGKTSALGGKNLIFCEEKLSLSVERAICDNFSGSFNTEVCSFGKFLRKNSKVDNLLSREGSVIAVKSLIKNLPLKCFNRKKRDLAPSLFELISQLKSAKISTDDISYAENHATGILKNKLADVYSVFSAYEDYLVKGNFCDVSAALSFLPPIIEKDESLKDAEVFLFGFSAFTGQMREIISSLLKTAKSVTAFLVKGENKFAFVNETAENFLSVCKTRGVPCEIKTCDGGYSKEGGILKDCLFRPSALRNKRTETDKVFSFTAPNCFAEAEKTAGLIRKLVTEKGVRYKNVTVAVPDEKEYKDAVSSAFSLFNVPYFLDEKKHPENYPLISLIHAYTDLFIKGFSLGNFAEFFKNRYVGDDKSLNDRFYNYLLKYNIAYDRLKNPLTFPAETEEELSSFENFRARVLSLLKTFDVKDLLKKVGAKEKSERDSELLKSSGYPEEASVTLQIYSLVSSLLDEISLIAGKVSDPKEFKDLFSGGVSAMEVSVIPQRNDAVFVGDFRKAAIYKADYLFVMGLTSEVPRVKEDVALLSDDDISVLSEIKILLEPKIRVVNHRERENAALGVSAFDKALYLSYPVADLSGKVNLKSEILTYAKTLLSVRTAEDTDEFATVKHGLKSFAERAAKFVRSETSDFRLPSAFFKATEKKDLLKIIACAEKTPKEKLCGDESLIKNVTSPTHIEAFYRCPYRAFAERALKAKDRDTGDMDNLNVGIFAHELFRRVFERYPEMRSEEDLITVFDEVKSDLLACGDFRKYLLSSAGEFSVDALFAECLTYCRKTYGWLKNSDFTTGKGLLEVRFGSDKRAKYPPVSLLGGKVTLSGAIDRIDVSGDNCRIIDYKTGSVDDGLSSLFAGLKLQLFLYSAAVDDKKITGAYYVKIKDRYSSYGQDETSLAVGRTVGNEDIAFSQDRALKDAGRSLYIPVERTEKGVKNVTSEESFGYLKKYAIIVSENAAKEMADGVIIPSPIKNACSGCGFYAVCGKEEGKEREIKSVTEDFIKESVKRYGEEK
ncbi:MAG: PD-(D/E)XK nuclease family protein [Clostridia bacterium]|nr:PD-(D/E)XK nuclease family protein [Clostridia bacterium]